MSDLSQISANEISTDVPYPRPSSENLNLSYRELPIESPQSPLCVEGVQVVDGMTLVLHGEVDLESIPHLEAVLDGLARLQPLQLIIDLSGTGAVSFSALALFDRYREIVGDLVLRSPTASTRRDLLNLGCSNLVEPRKQSC